MRRSPAKFSESEASNHTPSSADFTTTTPELKFSVHTGIRRRNTYHQPNCHIVQQIYRRNYKRLRNWQEAVSLGLNRCPHCNPPFVPPPMSTPTAPPETKHK